MPYLSNISLELLEKISNLLFKLIKALISLKYNN